MSLYCTYFDGGYLPRGLLLSDSLRRHDPETSLWVLCLDHSAEKTLADLALPGVTLVSLADLEASDLAVAAARPGRSTIEYYFTLTPAWLRYVQDRAARPGEMVTYLDADLFFYSPPAPLHQAMEGASIGLIEHRFPDRLAALTRFGRFNVGWVAMRNDDKGRAAAAWWRKQCLEWCRDVVEDDRFADQKYLDRLPDLFPGAVVVLGHPGANLARWNLARHRITAQSSSPLADGQPVVFYHFNGIRRLAAGWHFASFEGIGTRPTDVVVEYLYAPYLTALSKAEQATKTIPPAPGLRRTRIGGWHRIAGMIYGLRLLSSGQAITFRKGRPIGRWLKTKGLT